MKNAKGGNFIVMRKFFLGNNKKCSCSLTGIKEACSLLVYYALKFK